jgi:hypothetical protein
MTRRRNVHGIQGEAKNRGLDNLLYLEEVKRRKAEMAGRIIDPLGIPMGGNTPPQPQQGFNPIFAMLIPSFYQTIQTLVGVEETVVPEELVDKAWNIANLAFNKLGFRFVFPMGAEIIPPEGPKILEAEKSEPNVPN